MNHAQISSLTWYISDLRISSVLLTWNLRSCAPMFAVSVLYAIPGFEQLKTRLRVKVCTVLRCFTYFLRSLRSPYADNAQNVRGISVIVCENVAAIAFVDDFPLTISRHMTHVSRLLHLSITENHWKKCIGVCISNRIRKQAHVILMKYWWITDNSLITHARLASYKSGYFNNLPSVQVLLPRGAHLTRAPHLKFLLNVKFLWVQHEPPEERCHTAPIPEPEWPAAANSWDVGQEKEETEGKTSQKRLGERLDF